MEPWRARPVPFWRHGLAPPPRTSARVLVDCVPARRAADRVIVLDSWGIDTPSTKAAVELLGKLKVDGRVLVVLGCDEADVPVWKSLRNLQDVHVLTSGELNAYDVLVSDWVVFTKASLPATTTADAGEGSESQ